MSYSEFRAGAGIALLDLPEEQYPVHSQFEICEDKYDACHVRALAIRTEEQSLLIMAYELSDIPEVENLEEKIAKTVGFAKEDIVITVTHNHTSPCDRGCRKVSFEEREAFRKRFLEIEEKASLDAASMAVSSLRKARIGYGEIDSFINANEITRDPEIGFYCDPEKNGYSDKTLAVLKIVDEQGKLISVLMNHATHATFAMGLDANGKHATSGNFTGITSRYVEDYYGNGTIALWTSGAAGNQHPVLTQFVMSYTDGYRSRITLPNGAEHLLMQHAGRQHAIDAINCIEQITDYEDKIEIHHGKTRVKIENQKKITPSPDRPPVSLDYGMGVRSNMPEPAKPFIEPEIADDPEHPTYLDMEMITLGDTALLGLGCELFCQIGKQIKDTLTAKHTMVITHTPGYVGDNPHAVGYIVDRSSVGSHNIKMYRNLKPGFYDELIVNSAKELYEKTVNTTA